MELHQKSPPRVKFIEGKDVLILLKKLLVTLALYLIPVLFVGASLTLVQKWKPKPHPSAKKPEPAQVVDN